MRSLTQLGRNRLSPLHDLVSDRLIILDSFKPKVADIWEDEHRGGGLRVLNNSFEAFHSCEAISVPLDKVLGLGAVHYGPVMASEDPTSPPPKHVSQANVGFDTSVRVQRTPCYGCACTAVTLFSKLNTIFVRYFDPVYIIFDNKHAEFQG